MKFKKQKKKSKGKKESSEEDEWVEKPMQVVKQVIPSQKREEWMTMDSTDILFSGSSKSDLKRNRIDLADEELSGKELLEKQKKNIRMQRELNLTYKSILSTNLTQDESLNQLQNSTRETIQERKKPNYKFGDQGSSWRMMKLKRVFEIAQEESRSIQEVALERYGSLQEFEDAQAERAFLDGKTKPSSSNEQISSSSTVSSRRFMRPKEYSDNQEMVDSAQIPYKQKESNSVESSGQVSVPIALVPSARSSISGPPSLTTDQLNKLHAKVLKAKMMGLPEADELEKQYEYEKEKASNSTETVLMSNIDSRGNLMSMEASSSSNLNSKSRKQELKETHDAKGNRIKYAQDDASLSLTELVRQERMNQGDGIDVNIAQRIAADGSFKEDLNYLDEKADGFSQKKQKQADRMKQIAITGNPLRLFDTYIRFNNVDYKKYQDTIDKCPYCDKQDKGPRVQVIAKGTRCYLAFAETISMVPGHCVIVPNEHVLTFLDCDDDDWTEVRNFQKSLIRMFDALDQGVLFIEQVINFKWHKHTVIECIPVPLDVHADAPAYFKEGLNNSEHEWSQHKKLIDTSEKGIRRSLVKNLPYFHVWFDPNRGYGHVIEDSQGWNEWFGREILASALDLSPDLWRKPRRATLTEDTERKQWFKERWHAYDWTRLLK